MLLSCFVSKKTWLLSLFYGHLFVSTAEACVFTGCGTNAYCAGISFSPPSSAGTCTCGHDWAGDPSRGSGCIYPKCSRMNCGSNSYCLNSGPAGRGECYCLSGYVATSSYPYSNRQCLPTCAVLLNQYPSCRYSNGGGCDQQSGVGNCYCRSGYSGNPPLGICSDIDECMVNTDDCVDNAICTNQPGTYSCSCQYGYVGDGRVQCNPTCDVLACHGSALCVDYPGSVGGRCECPAGYIGDPSTGGAGCFPTCSVIGPTCPANSQCVETATGARCQCDTGYAGPGCVDIDECTIERPCHANGECTNIPGSFTCKCAPGFEGDGTNRCEDINECDGQNICSVYATCTNIVAGYECDCNDGYLGDGVVCERIDGRVGGGMMDDPHIKMWDGTWFDFMGACDLVLLHAPGFEVGKSLSIHVRTTLRYSYSYIEEAALQIGDDILEVTSFGNYAVNGVDHADLAGIQLSGYDVYHRIPNDKQHIFDVVIDETENITLSTFKDLVSVKINGGSREHYGSSFGIMGSFDGRLMARDFKTVMEPGDAFGQEWQVRDNEPNLFRTVRKPRYPEEKCIMPSATEMASRHRRLGEGIAKERAEKVCAHLEGSPKKACIFDVLAVGDSDIARAY